MNNQSLISFALNEIKLNDQSQVFRFLYAIWPKSKDLYPTYPKATQPPRDLRTHQVSIKFARLALMNILWILFHNLRKNKFWAEYVSQCRRND